MIFLYAIGHRWINPAPMYRIEVSNNVLVSELWEEDRGYLTFLFVQR